MATTTLSGPATRFATTITILTRRRRDGGIGNTITQNSIDGNGGLGVDLVT